MADIIRSAVAKCFIICFAKRNRDFYFSESFSFPVAHVVEEGLV